MSAVASSDEVLMLDESSALVLLANYGMSSEVAASLPALSKPSPLEIDVSSETSFDSASNEPVKRKRKSWHKRCREVSTLRKLMGQLEGELAGLKLAAGVWSTLPNFRNTVGSKLTTKVLVAEKTSKAFEWEMIAGQQSILRQISEGEHAKLCTAVLHRIQQAKEAINLTRHYGYDSLDMRPPLYNFGDFDELLAGMGEVYAGLDIFLPGQGA